MACVSDNALVELLEGNLVGARRAEVEAELEQCAKCRELARQWALASTRSGEAIEAEVEPTALGPFTLGALLGAGASGLVFRGRDTTLERDVAIKVVRASDALAQERALHEGRLLATVRHRNVIAVHAAGIGDGITYFAMELVEGTSLDHVIAKGPTPWRDAVRWFRGVAAGLAAVHAAGVIHRDIKPANVLLDRDELRIGDFGLATTRSGAPAGTPAYFAPELAAGAPATPASDQYAFFVTLYETITKERPGERPTWSRIPTKLRRVIERGLARDPAARHASLAAVERALAAVTRRSRWPLVAGALVLAGGAAVTAMVAGRSSAACEVPDVGWSSNDPRLARSLDSFTRRWHDSYTRACASMSATAPRRCLDDVQQRVGEVLAAGAAWQDTVRAIAELPAPERCLTQAVATTPALGPEVRRAATLLAVGKAREALGALPDAASDDAARALLRGKISYELKQLPAAETALRRALELAGPADLGPVLADASMLLALVVGWEQDRHDAGAAYADGARVHAQRIGDPLRAAEASEVRALIESGRGKHDAARVGLETALHELTAAGASDLEKARAEQRLGVVLREADKHAESRSHFERARGLRVEALGSDHPRVLETETELAIVDIHSGAYAEASTRCKAVLARLTTSFGEQHFALAAPWAALGAAQVRSGDYGGAETSFTRALELRRAELGDAHIDVARAYANLASLAYYRGDYARAAERYREAETRARSLLGDRHAEIATIRNGLALALLGAGKHAEARAAAADAAAIHRALPGHDADLAATLITAGMIEIETDQLAAARDLLEESLVLHKRVYGDDHVEVADVLATLSELYLALERFDDAAVAVARSRTLREEHGVAPQRIAENDFIAAMIAWEAGKKAEARAFARSARTLLGDARPDLGQQIDEWLRSHGAIK